MVAAAAAAPAAPPAAAQESWVPAQAYWRPVFVGGKTFPLARTNYFSLLEFTDDWHDVRLRLINGKWQPVGVHEGIDITAEPGTPILSMTDGTIENTGWLFYSGNRVGVRGADGRYYFYCHLSSIGPGISPGVRVHAGEVLGAVGNTGYGPAGTRDQFPAHLHFGIQVGSLWVNPYPTLVSLYRAAVEHAERDLAALRALAARGNRDAWSKRTRAAFTTFGR